MHPTKSDSVRLKKYESFQSKYDFSSLTYHVPLKDIHTFCKRNNCSINVYGISGGNDDQVDIEDDDIEMVKKTKSKMVMMISKVRIMKSISQMIKKLMS